MKNRIVQLTMTIMVLLLLMRASAEESPYPKLIFWIGGYPKTTDYFLCSIKKTGKYHISTIKSETDGMISVEAAKKIFEELERIGAEVGPEQFEKEVKGLGLIVIPDGFQYNSLEKNWHWNGDKEPMPRKALDFFRRIVDQLLKRK